MKNEQRKIMTVKIEGNFSKPERGHIRAAIHYAVKDVRVLFAMDETKPAHKYGSITVRHPGREFNATDAQRLFDILPIFIDPFGEVQS